jgi:carbon-monoxide dehydrogenase medium subunit
MSLIGVFMAMLWFLWFGASVAVALRFENVLYFCRIMKPPPFEYLRPDSVAETVAALVRHGGEAKLLAGGQSLMPMLNFRLLAPAVLVDINRIPGLSGIEETAAGGLRLGALTRHRALETSALAAERFPIVAAAMAQVGHLAVRNRGTIAGSLCHADPAAEWPLLALLLEAEIAVAGATGTRDIAAADFFASALETTLAADEMVTAIRLPALAEGHRWGFQEVARRAGDFALAAAGVVLEMAGGRIAAARIALTGAGATPLRARAAEALLAGQEPAPGLFAAAAEAAREAASPDSDLHASAD